MVLDLHRDPVEVGIPVEMTEGEFRVELLSVLSRIADALEEQNKGRAFISRLKSGNAESAESEDQGKSPPAKKNATQATKSRSYDDYREWDEHEDGSTAWQVKIDGKWVAATPLEERLFEKRLAARKGSGK